MKRFKFYIQSPSFGLLQLKYAPVNWNRSGYRYTRNRFYWGVTRKYMFNSLQFPKDGMAMLIEIKEAGGSESEAQLIVHERDNADYDFKEVYVGDFDFSTFRKFDNWVEIAVSDSSFQEKVKNREDVKVGLTSRLSMENHVIPGFTTEGENIILPARSDRKNDFFDTIENSLLNLNHSIPYLLTAEESGNGHSVVDFAAITTEDGSIYTSDINGDINISGALYVVINLTGTVTVEIRRYDSGFSLQETVTLYNVNVGSQKDWAVQIDIDESLTLATGDYINIVVLFSGGTGTKAPYTSSIIVKSVIGIYAKVNATSIMIHEAWSRIGQVITDENNPVYTELYGRTDSDPTSYAADGAESLAAITNGNMLRGFDIADRPISESLRTLFAACNARSNIGLGFETIGGVKKIRIELLEYFFGDEVVLAFSNATKYSESFAQDFIFNQVESGYEKAAYEEREGEAEYNNKSFWSTVIRTVKNILDLISDIRSDNSAYTECRKLPFAEFPTTDSKYDKDNFMTDLVRGGNNILNPYFNDWTGGDPDDWDLINSIVVAEVEVLGNPRCQITSTIATTPLAGIRQTFAALADEIYQFEMSYKLIHETDTDIHALYMYIWLSDGVSFYYLAQDGSWNAATLGFVIFSGVPTKLIDVASFETWSLIADPLPIAGNINIGPLVADIPGYTFDDVSASVNGKYMARTDEGFTTIENTVNNTQSYNLRWTPGRMIRASGMWIRAFLENHLNKEIIFNSSEKNSTVVTRLDTESADVVENENIVANDLNTPIWLPEVCECTVVVDTDTIETLDGVAPISGKLAIYEIVKVRETTNDDFFYGWILDFKVKTKRSKSTADLLLLKVSEYVNIVDNL